MLILCLLLLSIALNVRLGILVHRSIVTRAWLAQADERRPYDLPKQSYAPFFMREKDYNANRRFMAELDRLPGFLAEIEEAMRYQPRNEETLTKIHIIARRYAKENGISLEGVTGLRG